jgi:hypothetical protein
MQSCHLDVGFADFSTNIINRFFHEHFPHAIEVASQLKQRGGDEGLIFAVHPILLSLFLNCPPNFPHLQPSDFPSSKPFATMTAPKALLCPNATQVAAVKQAIVENVIVFDAFPLSAEPELYSAPVFTAGLDLVAELAASLNITRPRTLSQRDVPGLTRSVVPLLSAAGVHSVSIGANGGSASPHLPGYLSSREATLSTPFVWRDAASGSSVVAHWHPGGYGRVGHTESGEGVISSCIGTSALPNKAMCLAFEGDNRGPPSLSTVLADWKVLKAAFPHAQIKAGRFDDYFEQLQVTAVRSQLPVVESEVGDSWLYGAGSDPLKVQTMRVLQRHHDACVADETGACVGAEKGFHDFQRMLLLAGKHTWGGHTIIEDDGSAKDTTHYTAAQLREVRWSKLGFITQEAAWNEQRMQLDAIRTALGTNSALGRKIDAEMALVTGPTAMGSLVAEDAGWQTVPVAQWGSVVSLGKLKLSLDTGTGAITSLQAAGRNWASASHPVARFVYVTHDGAQADAFFTNYSFGCPRCGWAKEAFSKPGVTPSLANASITHGSVQQMWRKGSTSVAYRLSLPTVSVSHYGAPATVDVELTTTNATSLDITLRWVNKTTTRLPESLWLEMRPDTGLYAALNISKMNSVIDPNDVVANGSSLHAADSTQGVTFRTTTAGPAEETVETMRIRSLDAPLVAVGTVGQHLNLWHSPTQHEKATANQGIAWNLFNNLWNTNYVYWYPWRNATAQEDDGTSTFRWTLAFEA